MIIPKSALAVKNAASKDQTRFALTGILASQNCETAEMAATDGRLLLKAKWAIGTMEQDYPALTMPENEGGKKSGILPFEAIAKIEKAIPRKCKRPILECARLTFQESGATLATTNLENTTILPTKMTEGSYPNYQRILDNNETPIKLLLNVELLKNLVKSLEDAGAKEVEVGIKDALNPIAIKASCGQNVEITGAIMPTPTK